MEGYSSIAVKFTSRDERNRLVAWFSLVAIVFVIVVDRCRPIRV